MTETKDDGLLRIPCCCSFAFAFAFHYPVLLLNFCSAFVLRCILSTAARYGALSISIYLARPLHSREVLSAFSEQGFCIIMVRLRHFWCDIVHGMAMSLVSVVACSAPLHTVNTTAYT
ncbi:uncharacterized protein CC84DRAFT_44056 [Paraphaeosphaeria sporulosa]|uniref:Uncharacterized protein n=1 Tax=Paraphaeosphaeria sporulosa TaxID=1460663 RepID=A0A177CVX3_9PLEO|nr:uncharacterized protein CC84DRAFT_44056 [Paraphaeosphaeria sporulosa]OAG11714.1 hypothetical protein CC84DRAFT_44056 [Paraphaeosphaeria sporulosa]